MGESCSIPQRTQRRTSKVPSIQKRVSKRPLIEVPVNPAHKTQPASLYDTSSSMRAEISAGARTSLASASSNAGRANIVLDIHLQLFAGRLGRGRNGNRQTYFQSQNPDQYRSFDEVEHIFRKRASGKPDEHDERNCRQQRSPIPSTRKKTCVTRHQP